MSDLLFAATYDNIDNAWITPTAMLHGSGATAAVVSGAFWSGPEGLSIEEVVFNARDITFTDPNANVFIAHRISYSSDKGATWTRALTVSADADCPQIWDDTGGDNQDFAVSQPVRAWNFIGAGTGGLTAGPQRGPLAIPSNVWVLVEVAPFGSDSLIDMPAADLDSFDVFVYGKTHQ
jgi:hypothetical protein